MPATTAYRESLPQKEVVGPIPDALFIGLTIMPGRAVIKKTPQRLQVKEAVSQSPIELGWTLEASAHFSESGVWSESPALRL
jgi:hypothetical protein